MPQIQPQKLTRLIAGQPTHGFVQCDQRIECRRIPNRQAQIDGDIIHGMRGTSGHIGGTRFHKLLLSHRDVGPEDLDDHSGEILRQISTEYMRLRDALNGHLRTRAKDAEPFEPVPYPRINDEIERIHAVAETSSQTGAPT